MASSMSTFSSSLLETESIASPLQRRAEKLLLLQRHGELGKVELGDDSEIDKLIHDGSKSILRTFVLQPLHKHLHCTQTLLYGLDREALVRCVLVSLADDQRSTLEQKLSILYEALLKSSSASLSMSSHLSTDILDEWLRGVKVVFEALQEDVINDSHNNSKSSNNLLELAEIDFEMFKETLSSASDSTFGWLSALHRLVRSESVWQPVKCRGCRTNGFTGLRYQSRLTPKLQWCRKCFWRGRVEAKHASDTFTEFVAPPTSTADNAHEEDDDEQDDYNDVYNEDDFEESRDLDLASNGSGKKQLKMRRSAKKSRSGPQGCQEKEIGSQPSVHPNSRLVVDEEHSRIAELTREVAVVERMERDRRRAEELESKNAALVAEIRRLRDRSHVNDDETSVELGRLRVHRAELDDRLQELQHTRLALMTELEELIKVLRVCGQTEQ